MGQSVVPILLLALCLYVYGEDINLVFVVEPVQKGMADDINATLSDLKDFNPNLGMEIKYETINITDDTTTIFDQLCPILAKRPSFVIDFTYLPRDKDPDFSMIVPYFRMDIFLSQFLEAVGKILKEKFANDAALIFENEERAEEALVHIVRGFPYRVAIINAAEDDFIVRLKSLRPPPAYKLVFATGTNMNVLFEKLNAAKLFARPNEWHFVFMDMGDNTFKYERYVGTSTKLVLDPTTYCKVEYDKGTQCEPNTKIQRVILWEMMKYALEFFQVSNSRWYQQHDCQYLNSTKPTYQFQTNQLHSDILNFNKNLITYNFNMTISLFSNDQETPSDLAIFDSEGFRKINSTLSPAKRFFRIGTTEAVPWSYYRRDAKTGELLLDDDGNPIWEGYCIDFIQTLAEYMHFEYDIIAPKTGTFGKRLANGSWDGVVGDLVTGETDFVVAALKMTSEREEVIDYVAPYYEQTGISIVIRKAVRQTSLFKFMTVLRLEVWLSIVAALVATAVMIWILDTYSPYSARNNKSAYPYPCREFTLKESFWFALTSFTPQGGGEAPKAVSGRVLVAAYWLFVVLMLATFTANLAAFLTVERMQTPVQSLEQLARQSRINYTVVSCSDTHKYFINMKFAEDTLYRLWKELALNATVDQSRYRIWDYPIKEQYGHILMAINGSNPVKDAAEGFRKVNEHENADFAFIHDSAEIKYELTRNCNLTEVGEVFAEQPYALAVQQGSHLSDQLSYAILELQRDRYFETLSEKYWNHSLNRECSKSEDQEGITLESLGGVFIATMFGLILAMITLAAEVIYYRKKDRKLGNVIRVSEANNINTITRTPPPTFDAAVFSKAKPPKGITFGKEFKPVIKKKVRPTDFTVQHKDQINVYYE